MNEEQKLELEPEYCLECGKELSPDERDKFSDLCEGCEDE